MHKIVKSNMEQNITQLRLLKASVMNKLLRHSKKYERMKSAKMKELEKEKKKNKDPRRNIPVTKMNPSHH